MVAGACDHVFYLKNAVDSSDPSSMVMDDKNPATIKYIVLASSADLMARNRGGVLSPVCEPNMRAIVKILADAGL